MLDRPGWTALQFVPWSLLGVFGWLGGWDVRRRLVIWQFSLLKLLILRVVLHIIITVGLKTSQNPYVDITLLVFLTNCLIFPKPVLTQRQRTIFASSNDNYNLKMNLCMQVLCCCFQPQPQNPQTSQAQPRKKNHKSPQKNARLVTKYSKDEVTVVYNLGSKVASESKVYCCPICTLSFDRILACSQCLNFVCLGCFQLYDKKKRAERTELKCPFCGSVSSKFVDYELEPHSYFDTTKKGFLSKEERNQLDLQIIQPCSFQSIEALPADPNP